VAYHDVRESFYFIFPPTEAIFSMQRKSFAILKLIICYGTQILSFLGFSHYGVGYTLMHSVELGDKRLNLRRNSFTFFFCEKLFQFLTFYIYCCKSLLLLLFYFISSSFENFSHFQSNFFTHPEKKCFDSLHSASCSFFKKKNPN
jgi:hypothetical protein